MAPNPLYPGYYPGKPFVREPRYVRPPPFDDYIPDAATEFFAGLSAGSPSSVPKWLWQQEMGNLEEEFKARAAPRETHLAVSKEEAAASGAEELEEMPGAVSVSINLNPIDWIKDPVKTFREQGSKNWGKIADLQDFTKATKANLWKNDLLENDKSPVHLKKGWGPQEGVNVYDGVTKSIPDYMKNSASRLTRNSVYATVNGSIANALNSELSAKKENYKLEEHKQVIDNFGAKVDVINSMNEVNSLFGKLESDLDKGRMIHGRKKGIYRVQDPTAEEKKNKVDALYREVAAADKAISRVQKIDKASAKEVASYRRYIDKLSNELDANTYAAKTPLKNIEYRLNRGSEKKLKKIVAGGQRKMFNQDLDGGIAGGYTKKIVNNEVRQRRSKLNEVVHHSDGGISQAGKRVGLVSGLVTRDQEMQTAHDFVKALEDGDLAKQLIWFRLIRPRIERFTPSYQVGKFMKKTKFLGLQKPRSANTFRVGGNIVKRGIKVAGGAHFDLPFEDLMNASNVELFRLLNGRISTSDAIYNRKRGLVHARNLRKQRLFLLKNKKLGIEFTKNKMIANTDANARKIKGLFKEVHGRKQGAGLTHFNPKLEKVSYMGRYSMAMGKLQASTLGKVYNVTFKLKDKLIQKLSTYISILLEKMVIAATGGVGIAVGWAIRMVTAFVVRRAAKVLSKVWQVMKSFDIGAIDELISGFGKFIAGIVISCMGVLGVLFLIIGVFYMIIMTVFNSFDSTKIGDTTTGDTAVMLPPTNYYEDSTCGGRCPDACMDNGYGYYECQGVVSGGGSPQCPTSCDDGCLPDSTECVP